MKSKKYILIKVLFLLITTGFGVSAQAQQQKPSERSFMEEQKKIKEILAANNAKIRQMQKPSENASVVTGNSNNQQINSPASSSTAKPGVSINGDNTKQSIQTSGSSVQQPVKTKPSGGSINQSQRHPVHQL